MEAKIELDKKLTLSVEEASELSGIVVLNIQKETMKKVKYIERSCII